MTRVHLVFSYVSRTTITVIVTQQLLSSSSMPSRGPSRVQIGRATNILFKHLRSMRIGCRDRFVEWFSFHLSNFGYQWPWAAWSHVLKRDSLHVQQLFIKEGLAGAARRSYIDRVQGSPPDLHLHPHVTHSSQLLQQFPSKMQRALRVFCLWNQHPSLLRIMNL